MGKGNGFKNGITAEQAIKAAESSKGFVTVIADRLGVTPSYVYQLQKKFPTFRQAILDQREMMKDNAEGKLQSLINQENPTAIIFYLKTQAKDRGYVERQEVTGQDGTNIKIQVVYESIDTDTS